MPEVICNTSPLQYLRQLRLLHLLPALAGTVIIPLTVAAELVAGQRLGIDVPEVDKLEWLTIRQPMSAAVLALVRLPKGLLHQDNLSQHTLCQVNNQLLYTTGRLPCFPA